MFDIDIEHYPHCGGTLKIIAAIEDPPVIAKILTHLGLSARAPPPIPGAAIRVIPCGQLRPLPIGTDQCVLKCPTSSIKSTGSDRKV